MHINVPVSLQSLTVDLHLHRLSRFSQTSFLLINFSCLNSLKSLYYVLQKSVTNIVQFYKYTFNVFWSFNFPLNFPNWILKQFWNILHHFGSVKIHHLFLKLLFYGMALFHWLWFLNLKMYQNEVCFSENFKFLYLFGSYYFYSHINISPRLRGVLRTTDS